MDNFIILFMFMCFFHILDDFFLQRILADMKQSSWWEKNAPDKLYRNDYKCALVVHSFSWTFMIMLPILLFNWAAIISVTSLTALYAVIFAVNLALHCMVDNAKANLHLINLWQDQSIHLIQIVLTCLTFIWCL